MPIRLKFDGVDDNVTLPSTLTIGTNDGDFVEFKGEPDINARLYLYGDSVSGSCVFMDETSTVVRTSAGGTPRITVSRPTLGATFILRITKVSGTTFSLSLDGVTQGSVDALGATLTIDLIGTRRDGGFFDGKLDYVSCSTDGGLSVTQMYDSNASGGTGLILPETVSGINDGTLVNFPNDNSQWILPEGALTPDQATVKPSDAITWSTSLTGIIGAYLEDGSGNQYALTSVSDTGGTIPALAANLQVCLFGAVTLTVTDGVSAASAAITLDPPTGYTLTTLTSVPVTPIATDWVFDFDNPAVVGDQSLDNSATYIHNVDGTTSGVVAGTYSYFTIYSVDGVVSEITKIFESDGGGDSQSIVKSIVSSIVKPIVR